MSDDFGHSLIPYMQHLAACRSLSGHTHGAKQALAEAAREMLAARKIIDPDNAFPFTSLPQLLEMGKQAALAADAPSPLDCSILAHTEIYGNKKCPPGGVLVTVLTAGEPSTAKGSE